MAQVSDAEIYKEVRFVLGREPDSPLNRNDYLQMARDGASMKEIRAAIKKDTPVSVGEHKSFMESLGLEFDEKVRAARVAGQVSEEISEEVVPFEESVIAQRAMDNAEMEAKAYEDYYGVLLAEHNGDYDGMKEELEQDYVAAVKDDNTERILFLERVAQDLEDNKAILGKQASLLATQGISSLKLSDEYRERREAEIREDHDTGVLRIRDDLEYMEEKIGVEGTRLVEDYERARAYGDVDRVRELEGITDKYRVKMEDLGKQHSAAHTWRSGQRLVDVERLLRAQGRETEEAMAQIDRPIEEARIAAERGGEDVAREIGRAQELAGRETEDLRASMERDIAALKEAGARERLTLKQNLENKALSLQEQFGGEADPIIRAMNQELGEAGLEQIKMGVAPTEGTAVTAARRSTEDIQRGFEQKYGTTAPEQLIAKPGETLQQMTPEERGTVGREYVRGYETLGKEQERGARDIEYEKRLGIERAVTGAEESAREEYTRRLESGMVPPERAAEPREGGFEEIPETVEEKYGKKKKKPDTGNV